MQLAYHFNYRRVGATWLGAPYGDNCAFKGVLSLNEVGYFIVSCLEQETTEDQIVERLLQEYDTDEPTARASVRDIIVYLRAQGVLRQ